MIWSRTFRIIFILLFILRLGYAQQAQKIGFELAKGQRSIEIPFELYNNLVVVNLTLNRVIPLKFIVDTGVKTSILADRIYLDILNVDYDRKITIVGAAGGEGVEALVANNVKLEVPGLICNGISMFVMTEDYLRLGNSIGIPIQGILGSEIFNRFVVKIDYSRNIITLFEPSSFKKPRKFSELDITLIEGKPYINLKVCQKNGVTFNGKMMIDTGASHPIMLHKASDSLINLPEKRVFSLLGRGIAGDIYGFIARVDSVKINEFEFNEVIASFPEEATYIDIIRETGRQGTLGGGIMNRFTVIFDYLNEKLYLRKGFDFKDPFEGDMSGIEVIATGFDFKIFLVSEVEPQTPGDEAGILKGDVIIKIGHISARDLTLNKLNAILHSKPQKEVKVKIMRGKEIIKTKIVLRRLI